MARGTNKQVIQAWIDCQPLDHVSGKLRTDGKKLTSYDLVIGDTTSKFKRVGDYTAKGGLFLSQTNSEHVGLAKSILQQNIDDGWLKDYQPQVIDARFMTALHPSNKHAIARVLARRN